MTNRQRPSNGRLWWFIALALLVLALALAGVVWLVARSTPVSAQAELSTFLPVIAVSKNADASAEIVTLVAHDTTFVSAANVPGTCRVILTYIDRANGNRLHVAEDVGDRLVEIELPQGMALAGVETEDEFPGLKHASGFPLVVCGRLRIYANARLEDGGPFVLQRLDMLIPAPPTQ